MLGFVISAEFLKHGFYSILYINRTHSTASNPTMFKAPFCPGGGMHNRFKAAHGESFDCLSKGIIAWSTRVTELRERFHEIFGPAARLPWDSNPLRDLLDSYIFSAKSGSTCKCLYIILKLHERDGNVRLTVEDSVCSGLFGVVKIELVNKVAFDQGIFPTISGFRANQHKSDVSAFSQLDALIKAWNTLGFDENGDALVFSSEKRKHYRDKDINLAKKRKRSATKVVPAKDSEQAAAPPVKAGAILPPVSQLLADAPIQALQAAPIQTLQAAVLASLMPIVEARPLLEGEEPAEYEVNAVACDELGQMLANFSTFGADPRFTSWRSPQEKAVESDHADPVQSSMQLVP